MGWVRGFEPPLSRATTWRLRPLGDTHRERKRPTGRAAECNSGPPCAARSGAPPTPLRAEQIATRIEALPVERQTKPEAARRAVTLRGQRSERLAAPQVVAHRHQQPRQAAQPRLPAVAMVDQQGVEVPSPACSISSTRPSAGVRTSEPAVANSSSRASPRSSCRMPSSGGTSTPPEPRPPKTATS